MVHVAQDSWNGLTTDRYRGGYRGRGRGGYAPY